MDLVARLGADIGRRWTRRQSLVGRHSPHDLRNSRTLSVLDGHCDYRLGHAKRCSPETNGRAEHQRVANQVSCALSEPRKIPVRAIRFRYWLWSQFFGLPDEHLLVIFGGTEGEFIASEWLEEGADSWVSPSAQKLIARAVSLGAKHLVLAHNHPSGCANASRQDILATIRLATLCQPLDIKIVDHFIVTRDAVTSCADGGLI